MIPHSRARSTLHEKKYNYPSLSAFADFVQLKDLAPRTQIEYSRHLDKLAEHCQCDPASLDEARVRDYFLHRRVESKWGGSAMNHAKCSLRMFFVDCLKSGADWTVFKEIRIVRNESLPFVLTREDVARVLARVTEPRFRVNLRLIYECGLRVGESVALEVRDIDAAGRKLHVRLTKSRKDRFVPLSEAMIGELRQWWKVHRNRQWLFPSPGRGWQTRKSGISQCMRRAEKPMSVGSVQLAFRFALKASGVNQPATVHTLRHSYATHLLEEGVSIRLISQYLGHESLDTTVIYTHLTALNEARTQEALEVLHRGLG